MSVTYGLVCISEVLKDFDKSIAFKAMTRKRFNDLSAKEGREFAMNELSERVLHNAKTTLQIVKHCSSNKINHYRVSSKLFPLVTDPTLKINVDDLKDIELIKSTLADVGQAAKDLDVSLSIHPDQFNVLASEKPEVVNKTVTELNFHAWVLDTMKMPQDYTCPMNIHPSTSTKEPTDENLKKIVDRFWAGFQKTNDGVKKRLVVENEDKGCWTVVNLLEYFNIPVTYDNLHDKCNPSQFLPFDGDYFYPMEECAKTWGNVKPLFHYSESHPEKTNPRSHADMPTDCPASGSYDWDIELKSKDAAIRACAALVGV